MHPLDSPSWPRRMVVGPIAGVLALADSAREHDGVAARIDPRLAADAVDIRSGPLTAAARLLTFVGSEMVISVLALLLIIVLLERRGPFFAMCVAVAMAVSASLTVGVKLLVERAPPRRGHSAGTGRLDVLLPVRPHAQLGGLPRPGGDPARSLAAFAFAAHRRHRSPRAAGVRDRTEPRLPGLPLGQRRRRVLASRDRPARRSWLSPAGPGSTSIAPRTGQAAIRLARLA